MSGWKRVLFLPDTQIPYQDRKNLATVIRFIHDYQPDALYQVGDFIDSPEPSRWNKGMAGEYELTLESSLDEAQDVLGSIRRGYDGPFGIKMGNHDERVETYVAKYAPALRSLRALRIEALLDVDSYDVTLHRNLVDVAPGWVLAHGHEGSLNRVAGGTAAGLAGRFGKSVVCGHTHKAALKPAPNSPEGYNGRQARTVWGMEVGNLMDIRKAEYLKTGGAKWQQALGILYVNGTTVIPSLVPIAPNGTFIVEGAVYGQRT